MTYAYNLHTNHLHTTYTQYISTTPAPAPSPASDVISNPYVILKQEAMVGLWICLLSTVSIEPSIKNIAVGKMERGLATVRGEMLGTYMVI